MCHLCILYKLKSYSDNMLSDDFDVSSRSSHQHHSLMLRQPDYAGRHSTAVNRKFFKICPVSTDGHRNSASMLINKMYSWRKYVSSQIKQNEYSNRVTLIASKDCTIIGTVTSIIDSENGLLADEQYKQEINQARKQERSVCEFIKLAVDREPNSKIILGSLFHIAYIYARVLNHADDLFIEVNPRHAEFYKQMLAFEQAGEEKYCQRVQAPSVLLRLDFARADEQIAKLGGKAGRVYGEKSLYPYFFSKKEEEGMLKRLTQFN